MQHDHHIHARALHAFDEIIKALFAPAEFGWNEWSSYAASGEWF
jgi:hypothetical protein